MTDAEEMNEVNKLFDALQTACVGKPAARVMYAIGLMIAKGIKDNPATTDLETTMGLLRDTVSLEIGFG